MIYFKEEFSTIYLDEENKIIHLEWYGPMLSRHYRETLTLALDLVEDKKLTKLLVNMKDMHRIQIQDAEWRENIWFPKFIKSNIKKIAVIVSDDYFNELTLKEAILGVDVNSKIQRRRFPDVISADTWLRTGKIPDTGTDRFRFTSSNIKGK
jgi:hypothetical protein